MEELKPPSIHSSYPRYYFLTENDTVEGHWTLSHRTHWTNHPVQPNLQQNHYNFRIKKEAFKEFHLFKVQCSQLSQQFKAAKYIIGKASWWLSTQNSCSQHKKKVTNVYSYLYNYFLLCTGDCKLWGHHGFLKHSGATVV